MTVRMIWAQNLLSVIGADGVMPWHCPDDLRHFQDLTVGGTVVMGRKTYESIGHRLPRRVNIVVSSKEMSDGITYPDLEAALRYFRRHDVWVIGGANIYRQAMPHASELYVTEIRDNTIGDTFAPVISNVEWERDDMETHWSESSQGGPDYRFLHYRRRPDAVHC